jgi:hypothetical protein
MSKNLIKSKHNYLSKSLLKSNSKHHPAGGFDPCVLPTLSGKPPAGQGTDHPSNATSLSPYLSHIDTNYINTETLSSQNSYLNNAIIQNANNIPNNTLFINTIDQLSLDNIYAYKIFILNSTSNKIINMNDLVPNNNYSIILTNVGVGSWTFNNLSLGVISIVVIQYQTVTLYYTKTIGWHI